MRTTRVLNRFWRDTRGNFATTTVLAMLPIMGAVAMAVDYAELSRQKQALLNALDTTCLATARQFLEGATEPEAKDYAQKFFAGNLGPAKRHTTSLTTLIPTKANPRNDIECTSTIKYRPFLRGAFLKMLPGNNKNETIDFAATTNVKVQNTVEVALVLDNSGSMGPPTSTRMDILKPAAKTLVDTIAARGAMMKQVDKPVQFSLVPFAASVNVGTANKNAAWMDTKGDSPIHNQNFDWGVPGTSWTTIATNKDVKFINGYWRKSGTAWPTAERDTIVTRFTLFDELKKWRTSAKTSTDPVTSWGGCVESRPYPLNVNDDPATTTDPKTMFVPMFAPDEHDRAKYLSGTKWTGNFYYTVNDWWPDSDGKATATDRINNKDVSRTYTDAAKATIAQTKMKKYFLPVDYNEDTDDDNLDGVVNGDDLSSADYSGQNVGPNYSCSTAAITPLTDVTVAGGATAMKAKIDAMQPLGATNVPEGMAWGWRTLSSTAPFTEGRPEKENGNDKVLIVLTDGANTYYDPAFFSRSDLAANKSSYSAYGYTGKKNSTLEPTRLFMGQSLTFNTGLQTMANFTTAMNSHFKTLCDTVKQTKVIIMTVALDLDEQDDAEKKQIDALKDCASDSRFKKNADGTAKKLFWNSTSGSLSDDFKAIGDELSNLRVVF